MKENKHKNLPKIVAAILLLALLLLLASGCGNTSSSGCGNTSSSGFDYTSDIYRVKPGMTLLEVMGILGENYADKSSVDYPLIYTWDFEPESRKFVHVYFAADDLDGYQEFFYPWRKQDPEKFQKWAKYPKAIAVCLYEWVQSNSYRETWVFDERPASYERPTKKF